MLDPETHPPINSFQLSDGTRHRTHSYHDTWEAANSGLWPSKTAQFSTESKEVDDDDSGICSPPLWTTSPPHSTQQHRKNHYRSLSPASRTQAIVRGQRELMEMVRNMPESNYELSLKDLVEHHRVEARQGNNNTVEERNNVSVYKRGGGGGGGGSRKGQVKRSGGGNVERGGFYLKMVFPFSFGSKNKKNKKTKKKNESMVNSSSKVTPKPSGSDGSVKGVDKEWWKKSTSASGGSDSGASSINSGSMKSSGSSSSNSSSSRSNSRHEKSGGRCWHFIRRPKSQTQK